MAHKLLVIDDEPGIGELINDLLEFDDIEVIKALTPEDGLYKARYKSPSLILLDLNFPETNGFEVFKKLYNDPRTKDIPVMLITGRTDHETIKKVNEMGIKEVFYKPFQFAHLRKKIKSKMDSLQFEIKKCSKCHKIIEENWEYCAWCGKTVK